MTKEEVLRKGWVPLMVPGRELMAVRPGLIQAVGKLVAAEPHIETTQTWIELMGVDVQWNVIEPMEEVLALIDQAETAQRFSMMTMGCDVREFLQWKAYGKPVVRAQEPSSASATEAQGKGRPGLKVWMPPAKEEHLPSNPAEGGHE